MLLWYQSTLSKYRVSMVPKCHVTLHGTVWHLDAHGNMVLSTMLAWYLRATLKWYLATMGTWPMAIR